MIFFRRVVNTVSYRVYTTSHKFDQTVSNPNKADMFCLRKLKLRFVIINIKKATH